MGGGAEQRPYDVIVFGATSFVGQILCEVLSKRLESSLVRWAIAGRNQEKLDAVAQRLGLEVPRIVADAHDADQLRELVASTNLVVSTVGPYAVHGSLLVELAADCSTDYCDLTGEPQWMQRMIDAHHDTAVRRGARLIHACGFDSIPSDLGVLFTQKAAEERFGQPCSQISMRVKALKGAASGGTMASILNLIEEASHDSNARRILANPYALAPEGLREGVKQPQVLAPIRDEASGQWIAPFVMATVNTRIVHRSHALLGRPWGEDFLYDEAMLTGSGPAGFARASALAAGLAGFAGAASVGPLRKVLGDRVVPQPGEGPSEQAQERGFYDLRFYGTTAAGDTITTKVTGDRDPGYGSTAKMLAEAALVLLKTDPADLPGGFWTPTTAFGDRLTEQLQAHAGLAFTILD